MTLRRLWHALVIASLSIAVLAVPEKPYAPSLFNRNAIEHQVEQRADLGGARPYAPNLYKRRDLDFELSEQTRRSRYAERDDPSDTPAKSENLLARWGRKDEHKHRGCRSDSECEDDQYCSRTRKHCYKKLSKNHHCTRHDACQSGFCCKTTGKCDSKRKSHHKCHSDDAACISGYCSPKDDRCHLKKKHHEKCICDSGCQWGLECINGKCEKKREHHHHHHHHQPHPPPHPHPSGSPWDPKPLKPHHWN